MNQRWLLSVAVLLCLTAGLCAADRQCPKCEHQNRVESRFCGECGTKLEQQQPEAVPSGPGEFSDREVGTAVANGVKYLFSIQRADGSWPLKPHPEEKDAVGWTSLAAYALLESGVSVQDPRIQAALRYLTKHDTDRVYSLGTRCNVWLAAERERPGEYSKYLRHDGAKLIRGLYRGGYDYVLGERYAHNSTAQYGLLGVWAYRRAGGVVPPAFWRACTDYWVKGQQADGGWGYQVTWIRSQKEYNRPTTHATMVPAGVASLFICYDSLAAQQSISRKSGEMPKPIQRGLDWFDKNFAQSLLGQIPVGWMDQYHYYLYGVERVALASGYKYFGNVDWYKEGTKFILARQASNGSFTGGHSSLPSTAFALLFLIRGRHPVAFSKLKFDGDWNNRPRDLAFLTRWMGDSLKRDLSWQIVDFGMDLSDWLDAPILCISGEKKPTFSEQELARLREYVSKGGSIFSISESSGKEFSEGMRAVYAKLFPDYKLVPAEKTHAIYTNPFPLGGSPQFSIVSDGLFPVAIHCDQDLAKGWLLQRSTASKSALQAATNVLMYVTNGKLRNRGTGGQPK